MAGDWGIALSSAVNGAMNGMNLRRAHDQNEIGKRRAAEEEEDRQRRRKDEQDLRDSQAEVAVQTEQTPMPGLGPDATIQQYKVGQQMYAAQNEAQSAADAQNTPGARVQRGADVLRRQGKMGEAQKMDDMLAAWKQEGMDRAMDTILSGGDGDAAKQAYNGIGKHTLGDKDSVRVLRRYQIENPGFAPIDTAEVEIDMGGKRTVIPNLAAARHKLDSLAIAKQGYQAQKDDARAALDERKTSIAEAAQATRDRQADQRERLISAQIGGINARIAHMGSEGGAGKGGAAQGGMTTADIDKIDGELEGRAKGIFPDPEMGGTPEQAAQLRKARDQWKLMSINAATYARSNGQPMSLEFASQAALEAQRNPQARGMVKLPDGRVAPAVVFQGKTVQLGPPQSAPEQQAQAPVAPTAPQAPAAPKPGAQLAQAAAPVQAVPRADFAREVQLTQAEKAQQADYDARRAVKDGDSARQSTEQAALKALTPDKIKDMTAEQAGAVLEQYGQRLSGKQTAALRSKARAN